jgi:vitamin B12 transporter
LRRAKRSATVSATYEQPAYDIGFDALANSARKDFTTTLDGYVLVNITGGLALGRDLWLRARVENLFNEDYVLAEEFETADRSFFVELAYRPAGR